MQRKLEREEEACLSSTQFQEVGMISFPTGNAQCIVLEEEDLGTI